MKIRVTGDERDVANSAWVSTLKEIRAQAKTQDDVERVVSFLVEHHHTSPFESVTVTFEITETSDDVYSFEKYAKDLYSVDDRMRVTIDLLNFVKVTYQHDLWNSQMWKLFHRIRPQLANMLSKFGPIQDSLPEGDVEELLGDHGMTVELVHLHDEGDDRHSRATWRVKCPLSIAVQILRHRKGSYNMVSGRYKTIRQELYNTPVDVSETLQSAETKELYDDMVDLVNSTISSYEQLMKQLRESKKAGLITNDEYKRARECVRFVLPEGRMTELYITYYLSDFYGNYKKLRDSVHAQTEHIWIAQEMDRTIRSIREQS